MNGKHPSESKNLTSDEESKTLTHECSCPHHHHLHQLEEKVEQEDKGRVFDRTGVRCTLADAIKTDGRLGPMVLWPTAVR